MEKGNFRRERLTELGIDRLQRPPESSWSARSRRLQDRWHRFNAAGWERTFFVVACAVAVVVAIVGVVALATGGGGGSDGTASASSRPTEKRPVAAAKATPTAITIGVPDVPTQLPTETAQPTEAGDGGLVTNPPSNPTRPPAANTPVPGQPTSPPPTAPPTGLSAGDAIALGASYMTTSGPKRYTVDTGTCSAVHIGDHWIVSCTGRLAGCSSSACETQLQVCVYADRRVVSGSSC